MSYPNATVRTGLLLLSLATVALACSCGMTPREHVCAADFTIKVLVRHYIGQLQLRLTEDPSVPRFGVSIYDVEILEVLKSSPIFDTLENKETLLVRPGCADILNTWTTYVITANVTIPELNMDPFMMTDDCNYIVYVYTEDPESKHEVTDLLNTSNFGCDTERPDDENTGTISRMLRKLWNIEQ